jgi:Family of unknown function (DUF6245)
MTASTTPRPDDPPATVEQLAAAMAALGVYNGDNTAAEHDAEATRLGAGPNAYRFWLVNALLGAVQTEVILSDTTGITSQQMAAAYRQQLVTAGVADDPVRTVGFLRWEILRVWGPLREIAQNRQVGPLPLAAAHAADGLQRLLDICEAGQDLSDVTKAETLPGELEAAREALANAIGNIDILRNLLAAASSL